jgi:hypothetical protein
VGGRVDQDRVRCRESPRQTDNTSDDLQTAGLLSGSGGPTIGIDGSTNVNDVFMEASIPLVQGKPFAEQLSFDTAYRYSDYSSGITTDTYKFGMDWAPVEDVRFRASYQRAVRAPNIVELFHCAGLQTCSTSPAIRAVAAVQFPEVKAGQPAPPPPLARPRGVRGHRRAGGAVRLIEPGQPGGPVPVQPGWQHDAEGRRPRTRTPTASCSHPRFAPGLAVSIDYFDIKVDDLISTFGSANTLDACYGFNDAPPARAFHRDATGALWVCRRQRRRSQHQHRRPGDRGPRLEPELHRRRHRQLGLV